jgi:hypothetical protein
MLIKHINYIKRAKKTKMPNEILNIIDWGNPINYVLIGIIVLGTLFIFFIRWGSD